MKKFFFILRRVGKGIKADVKDPRDILGEMRNLIVFQAEHFGIDVFQSEIGIRSKMFFCDGI